MDIMDDMDDMDRMDKVGKWESEKVRRCEGVKEWDRRVGLVGRVGRV